MLRILVTGAAGLVGGEVCTRLVERGHKVTALVHRNAEICRNDGRQVAVAAAIKGDVSRECLGWDKATYARVASTHDVLIHCAATVRFDLPEEDYQAVNVGGTANALALAQAGDMHYLQVSTAYVCGTRNGMIREDDPLPDLGFANGYEASKAAGERLVRASGLRWTIARPSIVVGDSTTGAIRQFDTTYAAFKLIAEGRVRHMEARAAATLDFVPIDHVAGGIAALVDAKDQAVGGTYHLVSAQPLPVSHFAAAIGSYPQFHEPTLVAPENFDPDTLPAMERRLYRRVAGLYASYFQRDPHFDDCGFREVTGLASPQTGESYIRRLIDYCIQVGFLPPA